MAPAKLTGDQKQDRFKDREADVFHEQAEDRAKTQPPKITKTMIRR